MLRTRAKLKSAAPPCRMRASISTPPSDTASDNCSTPCSTEHENTNCHTTPCLLVQRRLQRRRQSAAYWRGESMMPMRSFGCSAQSSGVWHSWPARPSGSRACSQRGRRVVLQARQAGPPVRQQPAEQPDPAARRALTRRPAPALAVRPAPSAAGRPVLLPRNLVMNKQACKHPHLIPAKHC